MFKLSPSYVLLTALALVSYGNFSQAMDVPKWGKIICEAVTVDQAETFAQANHFTDNYDPSNNAPPPYVKPVGTLSCMLPVQVIIDTNPDGSQSAQLDVEFDGSPFKLPKCQLTYFDKTTTRSFTAEGEGNGYVSLPEDPNANDMSASFGDYDSKYETDDFLVMNLNHTNQIQWTPELPDENPHVPIISNCHVEY